jgi:triacylglycerol lipase
MNAWAQRVTGLLLTLAAIAALLWGWQQASALAMVLGVVAVLAIVPAVLAIECAVLLPWANRGDPTPKPTLAQRLGSWRRESITAYRVFGWWQPWFALRHADHLEVEVPAGAQRSRATVLVHGFFCNRALWNGWMPRLRAQRVAHIAVTMEPAFGDIDRYAAVIDEAIDRAWQVTGMAPVLVGHSMGGLAIRAWRRWRDAAHGDADARIAHAITIGTPHHGTATAHFSLAANARQMRRGSPWLQALAATESAERNARFTCFYSACDNIVMPAATATLPGADNRHLPGWAHVEMVDAPEVWQEVLSRVHATTAQPPDRA